MRRLARLQFTQRAADPCASDNEAWSSSGSEAGEAEVCAAVRTPRQPAAAGVLFDTLAGLQLRPRAVLSASL